VRLSLARHRRPLAPRPRRRGGPMARTRRLADRRVLLILAHGSGAALLLVLLVCLANGVVNLRADIQARESELAYLEARYAAHLAEWNRISAPEAVVPRAVRELGLVLPEEPGPVLVLHLEETSPSPSVLARVLDSVGGGGSHVPAVAAQERRP
jgi:cell division protein FtsB